MTSASVLQSTKYTFQYHKSVSWEYSDLQAVSTLNSKKGLWSLTDYGEDLGMLRGKDCCHGISFTASCFYDPQSRGTCLSLASQNFHHILPGEDLKTWKILFCNTCLDDEFSEACIHATVMALTKSIVQTVFWKAETTSQLNNNKATFYSLCPTPGIHDGGSSTKNTTKICWIE